MRIGLGYDIHKLVENRDLILGGVKIPYELGLLGHSDADVLVHAIIDSLLGSLALRDIGYHFPDTDERYKNANSLLLLKETYKLIQKEGYKIINIDSNIICQKPKLMNYIDFMRENIAKTLDIELNQISIKAKTNEKMDSTGNGTAIVANAVSMIDRI
ncbi:2-C-methyl-D-erythritol 2,4-cyclodiphosphate synthase [bacterium]|nr:2-C-methyl-D-erythritol 2,4-cyclodiphosphate synthase [bacterium]MBQ9149600.1 2-C-methyl-D-erythritol 2,4-cyclodiphosphate synthase [bacterium]